jgi:hypothetical protein
VYWFTVQMGDGLPPYCALVARSQNAPSTLAVAAAASSSNQCLITGPGFVPNSFAATASDDNQRTIGVDTVTAGYIKLTGGSNSDVINVIVDDTPAAVS